MTTYNLAIIVLIAAVALFITSRIARRSKAPNPQLMAAVNALRVVVLVLAAFYFYKRFVG